MNTYSDTEKLCFASQKAGSRLTMQIQLDPDSPAWSGFAGLIRRTGTLMVMLSSAQAGNVKGAEETVRTAKSLDVREAESQHHHHHQNHWQCFGFI